MRTFSWSIAALMALVGCAKPPPPAQPSGQPGPEVAALAHRVDEIDQRLKKIEKLLSDAMGEAPEPDPDVVYSVPIDGDPYEGPAVAKVTIVKGFEFACPFCYRARPTIDQIRKTYGDDVKVVYKYFVVHDQAIRPGLAACAADKQGKFSQMKELIWDEGFAKGELGDEHIESLAAKAGLDMKKFVADRDSDACMSWLKDDFGVLRKLGVRGTPAFYVNGRFISGAQPFEVFKKVIDAELAKANKAIAGGISASSYYQSQVVAKGKKEL